MFVHPELQLKKLSGDVIPSGRQLFERYGLSSPKGHPDNTDPYHFGSPSNLHVTQFDKLNSMVLRIRDGYATLDELSAKNAAEAAEESASEAETKTEDEAQPKTKDK